MAKQDHERYQMREGELAHFKPAGSSKKRRKLENEEKIKDGGCKESSENTEHGNIKKQENTKVKENAIYDQDED